MAKYVIIVPDGAADEPLEQFGGRTPLEAAETPNLDRISAEGRQGLVQTVPDGMEPGSDVAQMSLLGYDPSHFYSGRAPIEAAARGLRLGLDDGDGVIFAGRSRRNRDHTGSGYAYGRLCRTVAARQSKHR